MFLDSFLCVLFEDISLVDFGLNNYPSLKHISLEKVLLKLNSKKKFVVN